MDNKFLKGIVIGLVCSALLIGLTIGGYLLISKTLSDDDPGTGFVSGRVMEDPTGTVGGQKSAGNSAEANRTDDFKTVDVSEAEEPVLTDEEKKALFDKKFDLIMKYIDYYYYQDYDMDDIYDMMLHAMLEGLMDPYSEYYSPNEYSDVILQSNGNYSGIGAVVTQYVTDRKMYILYPYEDTPAYEVGLKPMDEIIAVNHEDVIGWDLDDVVSMMRGPEGTDVVLTIIRDEQEMDFRMTRREIVLKYVSSKMLDDDIGYIYCTQFTTSGAEQFQAALTELKKNKLKGLIVDLRDNPGGMVDACADMVDQILPSGKVVVYTEDKRGSKQYSYTQRAVHLDVPIVVLSNQNSASASEIFMGALRDNGVATIVGTQSFGKGIVQAIIPLNYDNSGIKLTGWRYFTPSGVCIDKIGIEPDVEIELEEGLETVVITERDHDNQLEKAIEVLKEKMKQGAAE